MKNISSFLERFKKITIPDESIRLLVVKILNKEVNLEDVSVKNGIIYIKTPDASLKSDIFLKKQQIIDEINKYLGKITIKDIR